MKVYRISEAEANQLRGNQFDTDSYFNPIQDADGLWFISEEEVMYLKKAEYNWIKSKTKVDYKSKDIGDEPPKDGKEIKPK